MGRSKEMGKAVSDLTPEELQKEAFRCQTLINVYGDKIAVKGLKKRLLAIQRRLGLGDWMENYRHSVEITVWRDGKILAVNNRRWGGFSCPGGKVDGTETPEEAAKRELLEETGCQALSIRYLGGKVHTSVPRDANKRQWYCTAFEADIGDQEPRASEPGTEPFWTTPENLKENSLYTEWYRWLFKDIYIL